MCVCVFILLSFDFILWWGVCMSSFLKSFALLLVLTNACGLVLLSFFLCSPLARWGPLDFNKGATASPSPLPPRLPPASLSSLWAPSEPDLKGTPPSPSPLATSRWGWCPPSRHLCRPRTLWIGPPWPGPLCVVALRPPDAWIAWRGTISDDGPEV